MHGTVNAAMTSWLMPKMVRDTSVAPWMRIGAAIMLVRSTSSRNASSIVPDAESLSLPSEAFNRVYVGTLERWGIYVNGVNPVARANTCPVLSQPAEPSFHAFCFTAPAAADAPRSFVIAGSGEAPEGRGNYRDHIVARGDTSPAALRRKALCVLGEMERRMAAFGGAWQDTTAVRLYTQFDVHPFVADELARRGAMRHGLTWHFNRPPVREIDYEMDCRAIHAEHVVAT